MTVHPLDPHYTWLYAAEVAACLQESGRWRWSDITVEAAGVAGRLAEAVYAGETGVAVDALVFRLEALLDELTAPCAFLASLGESLGTGAPDLTRLVDSAQRAFLDLRYHLYTEGRPEPA